MVVKFGQSFATGEFTVTLAISIGTEEQNGKNIEAIFLALMKQPKLKKVYLFLTGNLQFHWLVLKHNLNMELAKKESTEMDADWLSKNKKVINQYSEIMKDKGIGFEIITWETYKVDHYEGFKKYYDEIYNFYWNMPENKWQKFHEIVDDLVNKQARFRQYVQVGIDPDIVRSYLREYILEECAMLAFRMDCAESDHEIYMGRRSSPMNFIATHYKAIFSSKHRQLLSSIQATVTEYDPASSSTDYSTSYEGLAFPSGGYSPSFAAVCRLLAELPPSEYPAILATLARLMQTKAIEATPFIPTGVRSSSSMFQSTADSSSPSSGGPLESSCSLETDRSPSTLTSTAMLSPVRPMTPTLS